MSDPTTPIEDEDEDDDGDRRPSVPHEQDDPSLMATTRQNSFLDVITTPGARQATPFGSSTTYIGGNSASSVSWSTLTASAIVTEGAEPEVKIESDGSILLTMEKGRDVMTYMAGAVDIDGQKRRFRLSREEAQELALKLVRAARE